MRRLHYFNYGVLKATFSILQLKYDPSLESESKLQNSIPKGSGLVVCFIKDFPLSGFKEFLMNL